MTSIDNSRSLYDLNATNRGLGDPLEVASKPLLVNISRSIVFILFYNQVYFGLGHVGTDYDIHLIIPKACMTLMLQIGVPEKFSKFSDNE